MGKTPEGVGPQPGGKGPAREMGYLRLAARIQSAAERVAWERPVEKGIDRILMSALLRQVVGEVDGEGGGSEEDRDSQERLVRAGRSWIDRRIERSSGEGAPAGWRLIKGGRAPRPEITTAQIMRTWESLSPVERLVARLVGMNFLPEDIGLLLCIPPEVVKAHYEQACRKIHDDFVRLFRVPKPEEGSGDKEVQS